MIPAQAWLADPPTDPGTTVPFVLAVDDADLLPDEAAIALSGEFNGEPLSSPFLFLPWNSSSSRR